MRYFKRIATILCLVTVGCVSPHPGLLDPQAIGPSLVNVVSQYQAYVTQDGTLSPTLSASRLHEAEGLLELLGAALEAQGAGREVMQTWVWTETTPAPPE